MRIQDDLQPGNLRLGLQRLWECSARKIRALEAAWDPAQGAPVFTVQGRYTARGWTEWTQGFQFGSALLQFDATGEEEFLALGRERTLARMAGHLTHFGVHDHGFNNVSTYGALWRLMNEDRFVAAPGERLLCELALRCSGAVQAFRWTPIAGGEGYIYSFNGPHSLFADTLRSLRSLALAHLLGHQLLGEQDRPFSLLDRLVQHARTTARYSVYYGEGRDAYDLRGRVAHESLFNPNNGSYRCPNSQQGYSPFSTWTRGLAWIMLGFAEELEFLALVPDRQLDPLGGRTKIEALLLKAARAGSDYYIEESAADGVPYWDTGAPGLQRLGDWRGRPADPFNAYEPVDSSAAAIAAQGLLRLGHHLGACREPRVPEGVRYWQAGLTVLAALLREPYLSDRDDHQGLLLHSVYHRPNGWDYIPAGSAIPHSEASQWGDYHLREAALYLQRILEGGPYYAFFGPPGVVRTD